MFKQKDLAISTGQILKKRVNWINFLLSFVAPHIDLYMCWIKVRDVDEPMVCTEGVFRSHKEGDIVKVEYDQKKPKKCIII